MLQQEKKIHFIISFIFYSIIGISVYFGIKYLLSPLFPFITAFAIISMSQKIIAELEKRTGSKKKASVIFTLVFVLVFSLAVFGIFYGLFSELSNLAKTFTSENLSQIFDSISDYFDRILSRLSKSRWFSDISGLLSRFKQSRDEASAQIISGLIPKALSFVAGFLAFFPAAVIFTGIVYISMFYIGCDYDRILQFFAMQFPQKTKDTFEEAKNIFSATVKELFKSYILLTFITFCQLLLGFLILGFDYALLLAAVICIVDLLPILGTGTVLVPWAAVLFIMGNFSTGSGLLVLYGVITIFRQIIEPRIIGSNIGLSPLLSLIAIFAGFKLFGLFGIIFFPIILMTLIHLNEKGYIRLYKSFPENPEEKIRKTKLKFLNFKKHDK